MQKVRDPTILGPKFDDRRPSYNLRNSEFEIDVSPSI